MYTLSSQLWTVWKIHNFGRDLMGVRVYMELFHGGLFFLKNKGKAEGCMCLLTQNMAPVCTCRACCSSPPSWNFALINLDIFSLSLYSCTVCLSFFFLLFRPKKCLYLLGKWTFAAGRRGTEQMPRHFFRAKMTTCGHRVNTGSTRTLPKYTVPSTQLTQ